MTHVSPYGKGEGGADGWEVGGNEKADVTKTVLHPDLPQKMFDSSLTQPNPTPTSRISGSRRNT